MTEDPLIDAPALYRTPQRPGQSGEQSERRAGASPLSDRPTGPHPPYEPADADGLAAGKHVKSAATPVHGDGKPAVVISPIISAAGEDS